jgi:hypothetical protein
VRAIVLAHTARFVGAVFLLLAARGELSPLFAELAGWGDIAAATLALGVVALGAPTTAPKRATYLAWNTFGLLDLLIAVGSATVVAVRGDVPGMGPIISLPLVLVPTFFVPVLVASHISLFRRLARPS